jgi:ankyrin repeat protein
MDMVQYFEDLAEQCTAKEVQFRICFSSRHYPYIVIRRGIRLTLEDQPGHTEDLAIYVASRLRVEDAALIEELQAQLIDKAAGVFMWVVLVVDILNEEYRRGGMSLGKRLAEVPSDLSELFKDILKRDNENMEALLLCILWILYAKRPLQPKEFYYALWSGLFLKDLVDDHITDLTVPDSGDSLGRFNRYVISSSKGLAEITKSKQPTVQFIHESVSDFLIKEKGLHELWPELGLDCESPSHEKLKQCCNLYMNHHSVGASVKKLLSGSNSNRRAKITKASPFLEYSSQHILYHANAAARVFPQDEFLSQFPIYNWISVNNLFEKYKNRIYNPDASLFYILAEKGFSDLIRTRLKVDQQIHVPGGRYKYPLFAALVGSKKDSVAALLNLPSRIYNGVDITEGLSRRKGFKEYENRTPLSWAAQYGRIDIVKLLFQTRTTADEIDGEGRTPLSRASENGHDTVARVLIDNGADVNASNEDGWTPLQWASKNGHKAVASLLIDQRAHINANDKDGRTPLSRASEDGHETLVGRLINKGAYVNAADKDGWTPLQWASMNGQEAVARLLIENGADVNTSNKSGVTPLQWASMDGHDAMARLLVDRGADVDASNKYGGTPLQWASKNGHDTVAKILIDNGADVNSTDEDGLTPLRCALRNGHETVRRLLIDKGARLD